MDEMTIVNARYYRDLPRIGETVGDILSIIAIVDGEELSVPLDPNNRHYAEILRQVEAGELTIQEAE